MPVIPTYQSGAAPDTVRGITPRASGYDPIAAGLNDVSQGLGQAARVLDADVASQARMEAMRKAAEDKQAEERAKAWAGQQSGLMMLSEGKRLEQAMRTAPPGADGFADGFLQAFDKNAETAVKEAPDAPSKKFIAQHIQAMRLHFGTAAQAFQFKAGDDDAVNRFEGAIDTWAKVTADDARQRDAAMTTLMSTMPDVKPELRARLQDKATATLNAAAGARYLQTQPAALYALTGKALNIQEVPKPPDAAAGAPYIANPEDPRGIRNNNPGNIRLPAAGARGDSWLGQVQGSDSAFVTFDSPQSGIRAMTKNLLSYQDSRGLNTVQGIVSRWAPSNENDTGSYVKAVSSALGVKADQQLDLHDPVVMQGLVSAMIVHENGKNPYKADTLKQGVTAGLGLSQLNPQPPMPAQAAPAEMVDVADGKPVKTGLSFVDTASLEQILKWRQQSYTEMQRTSSADKVELAAKVKDYQAMVMSGVAPPAASTPTADEYARVYGPGSAHQYQAEVDDYRRTGAALTQLQTASAADRRQVIANATPIPGPDFENRQKLQGSLVQANALIEKQIVTDPAAYAAQNAPKVRDAWNAMIATQQDQKASDVEKRAAVTAFAQTTIAEQERLGVSTIRSDLMGEGGRTRQAGPRLLTNGQANDLAAKFASKPADAAQLMDGLQKQWGNYFPQVYGQLARDDKLPPAALVIPNMSDPYAKEQLARYADPKVQKELLESLPTGAAKDITSKLQSLNEPFLNSLIYQQGGIDTHAIVAEQQKVLAASYVAAGKSVGDASKLAFMQTVGWQYHFDDTMRIPIRETPEVVKAGTGMVLSRADLLDVAVPPSFRAGLKPEDRKAAWIDAIRHGATWITNGDETGLTLNVAAKTDAGQDALFAVRGSDGATPVSWTWSQLRDLGQTAMKQRVEALNPNNAAQRAKALQAQTEEDDRRRRREMGLR